MYTLVRAVLKVWMPVCISDAMHYTSNQEKYKDKVVFFKERIDKIGKAILLTSITTSFSFLTFLLNDIFADPDLRLPVDILADPDLRELVLFEILFLPAGGVVVVP